MKKIISSWIFVLAAMLILIFCFFFFDMQRFELKPPSEGWSRAVEISQVADSETRELRQVRTDTIVLPGENKFITLWRDGSGINYRVIDSSGNTVIEKKTGFDIKDSMEMGVRADGDILTVYNLENKSLKEYRINYKTGEALSNKTIDNRVSGFTTAENLLIYAGNNRVKIVDTESGRAFEISAPGVQTVKGVKKKNGSYYILIQESLPGNIIKLECAVYDGGTKISKNIIGSFPLSENISLQNVDIGIEKDMGNVIAVYRNSRTNDSMTTCYRFPLNDFSKVSMKDLQIGGFDPSPVILKDKQDSLVVLASVEFQKGRKSTQQNIAMFTYRNASLVDKKMLSRTDEVSVNPHFFTIGKDSYVQWEDVSGRGKDIRLAGTNPEIVNKTKNLKGSEWLSLLLDVIVYQALGLSFIMLVFISIILPSAAVIVIVSMFALNWVESNGQKVLNIAIGIQLLSKLWLANRCVLQNPALQGVLPGYLQNPISLFIIIIAFAAVPVYCLKKKYAKVQHERGFLEQYAFFAVIDMIIYVLIYFPYYSI